MGIERSSPQFVKNLNGPTQPSGPGFGYLLVSIMAVFLIVSNMYGFEQASGLPYMIGLSVAILAFAMRMYLLRRRAPYERATSGGRSILAGSWDYSSHSTLRKLPPSPMHRSF